ncbi:o-succinylbenzoate synthase [Shewanella atlantica]|uniref:o-succinylbenzoate synthase n=1 Tax=Shewanella atlantica TaxID=271099 RepID=A0A3S0KEP7_9GAMM|nr:o-succinylbenzoate synthase [Shewanella atlantica]RTR28888.1 o-succinylbenzoate synthase [Shewanella atlantica]
MIISALHLYQYQIPLDKLLPVGSQRIDVRRGLVLKVEAIDETGAALTEQAEIAPLSGLDIDGYPVHGFSKESLAQVSDELESLLEQLVQKPIDSLLDIADIEALPSLAFGLSLIHAKLSGRLDGHALSLNSDRRTIPLLYRNCDESINVLHQRVSDIPEQMHAAKVKVAQTSLEEEVQLIHQILAIRPDLKLRLDANRGFTLEQAIDFAACLPLASIEYIEEPCQRPADNAAFYQAIGMPWALDESLNDPGFQFTMQPGLTALVVKPMLVGSLEKLQKLQAEAEHSGVRFILSSSLEASLGIEALARLSQIMTPDEIPGLDTLTAFSSDLLVCSGKSRCQSWNDLTLIKSC